jgi:hypothetical protein
LLCYTFATSSCLATGCSWQSHCSLGLLPLPNSMICLYSNFPYTPRPTGGSAASPTYSISFGCPPVNPAACLCTIAISSLEIATEISICLQGLVSHTDKSTATALWASYCRTNAGVSARDETVVQDIPLYTEALGWVGSCVTGNTASYITSYGCTEATRAPCLCSDPASSQAVGSAISTCSLAWFRNRSFHRDRSSSVRSVMSICNIQRRERWENQSRSQVCIMPLAN